MLNVRLNGISVAEDADSRQGDSASEEVETPSGDESNWEESDECSDETSAILIKNTLALKRRRRLVNPESCSSEDNDEEVSVIAIKALAIESDSQHSDDPDFRPSLRDWEIVRKQCSRGSATENQEVEDRGGSKVEDRRFRTNGVRVHRARSGFRSRGVRGGSWAGANGRGGSWASANGRGGWRDGRERGGFRIRGRRGFHDHFGGVRGRDRFAREVFQNPDSRENVEDGDGREAFQDLGGTNDADLLDCAGRGFKGHRRRGRYRYIDKKEHVVDGNGKERWRNRGGSGVKSRGERGFGDRARRGGFQNFRGRQEAPSGNGEAWKDRSGRGFRGRSRRGFLDPDGRVQSVGGKTGADLRDTGEFQDPVESKQMADRVEGTGSRRPSQRGGFQYLSKKEEPGGGNAQSRWRDLDRQERQDLDAGEKLGAGNQRGGLGNRDRRGFKGHGGRGASSTQSGS